MNLFLFSNITHFVPLLVLKNNIEIIIPTRPKIKIQTSNYFILFFFILDGKSPSIRWVYWPSLYFIHLVGIKSQFTMFVLFITGVNVNFFK